MKINERGSTLITVLLIIVIFTVVGLSLVGMNVNNSKQVSKTGDDLQATNLAEMGVVELKQEIFSSLNKNSPIKDNKDNVYTVLKEAANKSPYNVESGKNASFIIKTPKDSDVTLDDSAIDKEIITVNFTSTGISENNQKKEITGTLDLMRPKPIALPVNPPGVYKYSDFKEFKKVNDMPTNPPSLYFEQGFSLKAEKSPFNILQDLYSRGSLDQENMTTLRVQGDAYLNSINQKTNGNLGLLCIKGTLFLFNGKPSNFDTDYHEDPTNGCFTKTAGKNEGEHGIYASNISFYPSVSDISWDMNNNSIINLQYK